MLCQAQHTRCLPTKARKRACFAQCACRVLQRRFASRTHCAPTVSLKATATNTWIRGVAGAQTLVQDMIWWTGNTHVRSRLPETTISTGSSLCYATGQQSAHKQCPQNTKSHVLQLRGVSDSVQKPRFYRKKYTQTRSRGKALLITKNVQTCFLVVGLLCSTSETLQTFLGLDVPVQCVTWGICG